MGGKRHRRVASGRTTAFAILAAGLCAAALIRDLRLSAAPQTAFAVPPARGGTAAGGNRAAQDALTRTGVTSPALAVVFYSGRGGNQDVYLLPPGEREPLNLTRHPARDLCPAPSPDGTRIAFMSDRGGNLDIYSMATDGSDVRQLTSSPDTEMHPEYSPDGSRIVFVRDFQQRTEIWIMNVDGSGQKRLTSGSWRDERPFVSPDGSTILFMSNRDGNYEIYTMAFDGSRQARLTSTPQLEVFPAWSPDGKKIVYSQKYRVGSAMEGGIRVMNADGSNDHAVTGTETRDENGLWSPDGRRIIFQSVRDGNFEVYQVDADGRNPVRLTHDPAWDGWASFVRPARRDYPTLTHSGTLYFSSNRPGGLGENDIYRVRRLKGRWTAPENLGAPINTR